MADDTWLTVELPILESVRLAEIQGKRDVMRVILDNTPGLNDDLRIHAIVALEQAEYLEASHRVVGGGATQLYSVGNLKERGRRAVRQWPSDEDVFESLVSLLEQKLSATTDPGERGKIASLLSSLRDVGTGVITDVIGGLIRRSAGMP